MKELDPATMESLAAIMCTDDQIAAYFNVPVELIQLQYGDVVDKGREKGKIQLRQWQINHAKNGNIDMLKWLGKQYLGQE